MSETINGSTDLSRYIRRMPVKLFEVRDRATFMPVMAVKLFSAGPSSESSYDPYNRERERWLLRRAGYGYTQISGMETGMDPYIILVTLDGVRANYDPFSWGPARTLGAVHQYIIEHWDELKSGDLLDVEFILHEKPEPKVTEQIHGEA